MNMVFTRLPFRNQRVVRFSCDKKQFEGEGFFFLSIVPECMAHDCMKGNVEKSLPNGSQEGERGRWGNKER